MRVRGEMIRTMMEYAGVRYEDKRYLSPEQWVEEKSELGLDFPNLPYLIDGQVKISESMAVLRYAAEKWRPDLLGATPADMAFIGQLSYQVGDIWGKVVGLASDKANFEARKATDLAAWDGSFKKLHDWIEKKGGNFLHGNVPCVADFQFLEFTDLLFLVDNSLKRKYPLFNKVRNNIAGLPKIQAYRKSARYVPLLLPAQMMAVKQHIKPVLGYWMIRGRGQEIRWALQFMGVDYLEVKYQQMEEWAQDKPHIESNFPNLPYFVDPDTGDTLVESMAVLLYVCGKYQPELLGNRPSEKAKVANLALKIKSHSEQVYDFVFDKENF